MVSMVITASEFEAIAIVFLFTRTTDDTRYTITQKVCKFMQEHSFTLTRSAKRYYREDYDWPVDTDYPPFVNVVVKLLEEEFNIELPYD